MFKKILLGLAAVVVIFVLVVATRPNTFSLSRSIVINAPASAAFAVVNDLHRWDEWSPWSKRDPQMKKEFSGAASGVGASYAWDGNKEVGKGHQTIVESKPNESVKIDLVFEAPFAGQNTVVFSFVPEGQGTKATWSMSGPSNFISKFFVMTGMMDKMVGKDFDEGLASLKALAEKPAPAPAKKK
jgi:ribosome-associated toxin RatA of RatAB toxin-antitoxin module